MSTDTDIPFDPRRGWAPDDDGDHSAFTHRDDDEDPPYAPSPDPIPTATPLSAAEAPRYAVFVTALARIEEDARWLQEHVPDYSPDGVATLRDIAREIEREAQAATLPEPEPTALRIDVDRLAEAIHEAGSVCAHEGNNRNLKVCEPDSGRHRRDAALFASEYARLGTPPREPLCVGLPYATYQCSVHPAGLSDDVLGPAHPHRRCSKAPA